MKISYRIILVNLLVVAIVLGSAAVAFYSAMYNTLNSQQSKDIVESSRNFVFIYRSFINDIEKEFLSLTEKNPEQLFDRKILVADLNDFFLEADPADSISIFRASAKNWVQLPDSNFTIKSFLELNPYAVINIKKISDGKLYYFGKIINSDILDDLAKRSGSDVALIVDNYTAEVSNSSVNLHNIFLYNGAYDFLSKEKISNIFVGSSETSDIIATLFKTDNFTDYSNQISFVLFKSHSEFAELRIVLRNIIILISIAGIIIAVILSFLLTYKLRERIADLNFATEQTKAGFFNTRIKVKSDDEIGKLGSAFNLMLDELEKNQRIKNEYAEFITLINQNASFTEISKAALKKIISTCGFLAGALYSVDGDQISLAYSHGLTNKEHNQERNEFYRLIINSKEPLEISSYNNLPTLHTGTADLNIGYLILIPVIYNNKVIAILELASLNKPDHDATDYLVKIQEQLAIGLTNAKAVIQLENFVEELKKLNDDFQQQNKQIIKQNEILTHLSSQLQTKAEELEIQKQKAEESTKLKSQFLANMSHELRTPMNSILGLTELIIEKAQLSNKDRERMLVVLKSGKRLMNLINDILDLSKIETGKLEFIEDDLILEEIIEEVTNIATPLALEKGLEFNVQRKCNTRVFVTTDRERVLQILINLIGNALKFTYQGKVELSVQITPNNFLLFSVSDTGIGISEDNKKIIFDEFRQIDGATSRKYSGTGLGLAICKKLVQLLGGEISVSSLEGEGSVFSFTIPLVFALQKNKRIAAVFDNKITAETKTKKVIYVIDDNAELRNDVAKYFTLKGYEVFQHGNEDFNNKFILDNNTLPIILDIVMPKRDEESEVKIPVIFLSLFDYKVVAFTISNLDKLIKPMTSDFLNFLVNKTKNESNKNGKKISFVLDNQTTFDNITRDFNANQIEFEFVENKNAIRKISESKPDFVVVDLMLPDIDGINASIKIKSDPLTNHVPIILACSKQISNEERKTLLAAASKLAIETIEKSNSAPVEGKEKSNTVNGNDVVSIDSFENSVVKAETLNDFVGVVLIVDDDADTLFTLNEMIESIGCKTYTAKSGIECLIILENHKPDLILLDIMMPEMDGFQTLKNIRANSSLAHIPIYAVTAKAMVGDKEVILKHGFNDYIPKPVSSIILASKIKQFFSKIKSV